MPVLADGSLAEVDAGGRYPSIQVRVGAGVEPELREQVPDALLDRLLALPQPPCDLVIAQSQRDQLEDLALAVAERLEVVVVRVLGGGELLEDAGLDRRSPVGGSTERVEELIDPGPLASQQKREALGVVRHQGAERGWIGAVGEHAKPDASMGLSDLPSLLRGLGVEPIPNPEDHLVVGDAEHAPRSIQALGVEGP